MFGLSNFCFGENLMFSFLLIHICGESFMCKRKVQTVCGTEFDMDL